MSSIIPDGLFLINRMLDDLAKLYPGFEDRLTDILRVDQEEKASRRRSSSRTRRNPRERKVG
jgi:hypothetical protein